MNLKNGAIASRVIKESVRQFDFKDSRVRASEKIARRCLVRQMI